MTTASHLCMTDFPVQDIKIGDVLKSMNDKSKIYATYLSLAVWAGYPIIASQSSVEAMPIHEFLSAFITEYQPQEDLPKAATEKDTPLFYLLEYASQFYYNSSNYQGYGDTKFIPRCTTDQVLELLKGQNPNLTELFNKCADGLYSVEPASVLRLGFYPYSCTTYYQPAEFTQEEQQGVDNILKAKGIRIENTIIIRNDERNRYEVSIASIDIDNEGQEVGEFKGKKVVITKGRLSEVLKKVNHWLQLAHDNAENETQKKMIAALIEHYQTGSIEKHEEFSEQWVHDTTMTVEMHHGFIESYRDPSGVRCEFEGFAAAVDPKESECLHDYVNNSAAILGTLPYPKEYERKNFKPPSYNAINILTYCSSGYPIGINIPNYDRIKMNVGFKNVSLTNIMASSSANASSFPFLQPEQAELLVKNAKECLSFHVASHELYGHGSATMLKREDVVGKNVVDFLNPDRFVTTYYADDAKYDEAFGAVASAFEECRAETTAVYLAFKNEALDIFKVPVEQRSEFSLCEVLSMVNSAMKTLYCYSPETSKWLQAHSAARFAILRALIIWGRNSVQIRASKDANGENEYRIFVDPNNLDGAYDAIENLLKHLNYYKTTAQVRSGQEFFKALTSFDDFWLDVRRYTITQKPKRAVVCQAIIKKTGDGKYELDDISSEPKTTYDVAKVIVTNIRMASE